MTDESDLHPEHDAVRRLLADARHDGSTPPAVVARLDGALAGLVAERAAATGPHAPVVDLGARRRRVAGMGLLAAAAVVVAGVAIGQGLPGPSGEDSSAGSDMATSAEGGAPEAGRDGAGGSSDSQLAPESMRSTAPPAAAGLPSLVSSADTLDDQLLVLRDTSPARSEDATLSGPPVGCGLPGAGPGRRVVAEVDGQVGVVLFGRPTGQVQDVAVYVCGDPEPVATATLPAP